MSRIKETTVYQFAELNERAKERARDWYREASAGDTHAAECITEDFGDVLAACGFDVATRRGSRTERAIYWDTNPIDGAFDASWRASRVNVAALIADRPVSYTDSDGKPQRCEGNARLVPLLERFAALAAAAPDSYGSTNTGRYCNMTTEWQREVCTDLDCDCDALGDEFGELSRELGAYLGRSVSDELEYQNSDAQVDETIVANEYEFTEDGARE